MLAYQSLWNSGELTSLYGIGILGNDKCDWSERFESHP